jgi:small-conductance mechanosensitive channel
MNTSTTFDASIASLSVDATQWLAGHWPQLTTTLAVLTAYWILDRLNTPRLEEGADSGGFKDGSATQAIRVARIITGFVGVLVLALVWGVDFHSVFIFASTTLTLLGVALFASWSLLSNVTAYFVLLLQPSFRRGNFIRIIDVDNYTEGYIAELTPFHTRLVTENRETVVYPNNLLLGRPTLINPRDRLAGIGKLPLAKEPKTGES